MGRELIWVEKERFQGWMCSACGWEFRASGPPIGNTIEEMKQNYERRRDEAFKDHVCAKHPPKR
jgi:hypothetical protein